MGYQSLKTERFCLECGTHITGRKDKKFCGLVCKNIYNNNRLLAKKRYRQNVLEKISKNYELLEKISNNNNTSVPMEDIVNLGFDRTIFTGCIFGKAHTEFYCFDIGYYISRKKLYGLHRIPIVF